jgi:hypothetical protein
MICGSFDNAAASGFAIRGQYFSRFADWRFADPIIFCGLKTSANLQIHYFSSFSLKFKDDFWLLGHF